MHSVVLAAATATPPPRCMHLTHAGSRSALSRSPALALPSSAHDCRGLLLCHQMAPAFLCLRPYVFFVFLASRSFCQGFLPSRTNPGVFLINAPPRAYSDSLFGSCLPCSLVHLWEATPLLAFRADFPLLGRQLQGTAVAAGRPAALDSTGAVTRTALPMATCRLLLPIVLLH